jgi:biopolymer transport protein ExbB
MFDFILKGGFLMWPILFCSVISLAIILERLYHFHRVRIDIPGFFSSVKGLLEKGKKEEALMLCQTTGGPFGKILSGGIQNHKRSYEHQEKAISRVGSKEVRNLEKHLRGLAIIGNITPLLGLLGTVTGMIRAFMKIQELGGRVDANALAGGIWEALLTTAAGLSVGIPTLVAYHYFEGRVDNIAAQMKDAALELLEFFNS